MAFYRSCRRKSPPLPLSLHFADIQAAASFAALSSEDRKHLLRRFRNAGKTLRVGAFGRGDTPASSTLNAIDVAKSLANFTLSNGLNGIDINFEDTAAVENFRAPGWLNSFHAVLLQELKFYDTGKPSAQPSQSQASQAPPTTPTPAPSPSPNQTAKATGGTNNGTFVIGGPRLPPLPPVVSRPLLTYSPPAVLFAGRGGEEFARFFRAKQGSVARLIIQFYSANATYDTAEALFGNGTEAAPGRARIAAMTEWEANKIIVQKPLAEAQPGHVDAEKLGELFCQANQRVNGLSVFRIDYRDTDISNHYLAELRGFKCGNQPSSPPPNPVPSLSVSAPPSETPSASPSVACPV